MAEVDQANKKSCSMNKIPLLKFFSLVLGYLTIQIGWHAHFDSEFNHDMLEQEGNGASPGRDFCWHQTPTTHGFNCPFNVFHLEAIFVFTTICYFAIELCAFVAGLVCTIAGSKLWYHDKMLHIFGAVELFINSGLMLASVAQIDIYRHNEKCWNNTEKKNICVSSNEFSDWLENMRHHEQFLDKIVAGVLCFIWGIVYTAIAVSVAKQGKAGKDAGPEAGGTTEQTPSPSNPEVGLEEASPAISSQPLEAKESKAASVAPPM